jgi:hypothetical protein
VRRRTPPPISRARPLRWSSLPTSCRGNLQIPFFSGPPLFRSTLI